jgi:hypothetical protein
VLAGKFGEKDALVRVNLNMVFSFITFLMLDLPFFVILFK